MTRTERFGTSHGDAPDFIKAGNFVTRKPEPGCGAITLFTWAHPLFQPAADRGGYFGLQAGSGKFIAANEEILTEFGVVWFEGDYAAPEGRQLLFHLQFQASQT